MEPDVQVSKRITVCKVLCMLCVVMIHAYISAGSYVGMTDATPLRLMTEWVSQVLTRSAVPLFFFLSAYLLYRKPFDFASNMKKKVKTLVIPYFACIFVTFFVFWIASFVPGVPEAFSENSALNVYTWGWQEYIGAFLTVFAESESPLVAPFWFLRDLIILNLVAGLILLLCKKAPRAVLLAIAMFYAIGAYVPWPFNLFHVQTQSFVFFTLGCLFALYPDIFKKIFSIPFPAVAGAYVLLSAADVWNYDGASALYQFFSLHALTVVVGMLFWYQVARWIASREGKGTRFVCGLAPYMFFVYAFHEIPLSLLKKVFFHVFPNASAWLVGVAYWVLPAAVVAVLIGVGALLRRFLPVLWRILTGARDAAVSQQTVKEVQT